MLYKEYFGYISLVQVTENNQGCKGPLEAS